MNVPCTWGGCHHGKVVVTVHSAAGSSQMTLTCPHCDGRGVIPAALEAAEREFWCRCGNPSGEAGYVPDGHSTVCRKHHWTCADCGRVLQVG